MRFGYKIKEKFVREVATPPDSLLDEVVDWVADNLEPEEVYEAEKLEQWAFDNDFKKFE